VQIAMAAIVCRLEVITKLLRVYFRLTVLAVRKPAVGTSRSGTSALESFL